MRTLEPAHIRCKSIVSNIHSEYIFLPNHFRIGLFTNDSHCDDTKNRCLLKAYAKILVWGHLYDVFGCHLVSNHNFKSKLLIYYHIILQVSYINGCIKTSYICCNYLVNVSAVCQSENHRKDSHVLYET